MVSPAGSTADAVEARQEDDLAAAQVGDLLADQADCRPRHDPVRVSSAVQDRRPRHRAGPEHHCRPPKNLSRSSTGGRHRLALAKRVAVADDGGEAVEELVVDRWVPRRWSMPRVVAVETVRRSGGHIWPARPWSRQIRWRRSRL
jgi:hypothetical protein